MKITKINQKTKQIKKFLKYGRIRYYYTALKNSHDLVLEIDMNRMNLDFNIQYWFSESESLGCEFAIQGRIGRWQGLVFGRLEWIYCDHKTVLINLSPVLDVTLSFLWIGRRPEVLELWDSGATDWLGCLVAWRIALW